MAIEIVDQEIGKTGELYAAQAKAVFDKAGIKMEADELAVRGNKPFRWFIATQRGYANMRLIEPGERFLYDGKPGQWCHPEGEEPQPRINFDRSLNALQNRPAPAAEPDPSIKMLLESNQREIAALMAKIAELEKGKK